MRGTIALLTALALLCVGCGSGTEVVTVGDGIVDIDGTDSSPTTPVTELEATVPGPGWHVRTYGSDLGACLEVEEPGGRREVRCAAGSGLDGPPEQYGWLNGPMWRSGAGWAHVGLARAEIVRVAVVADGEVVAEQPTLPTVGSDLRGYVIWAPSQLERYELTGYDADGCARHREPVDISPAEDEEPPTTFSFDC